MTPTQFQTFMQQLDDSLREIGHEASEDISDAVTATIIKGAITKVRLGLRTIGNQVSAGSAQLTPVRPELAEKVGGEMATSPTTNPVDLYYQHQDWLAKWEAVA
jgi:hypothetical protein